MFPLIFYGGDIIKKRVLAFVMMMVVAFSCFALPASALGGFMKRDDVVKDLMEGIDSDTKYEALQQAKLDQIDTWIDDLSTSRFNVSCANSKRIIFLWSEGAGRVGGWCYYFPDGAPDQVSGAVGNVLSWQGSYRYVQSYFLIWNYGQSIGDRNANTDFSDHATGYDVLGSKDSLFYTDIPIAFGDDIVKPDSGITWNVQTNADDFTATVTASSDSDEFSHVSISIHNQSAGEPSEATKIPWSVLDNAGGNFNKENPYSYTISFRDFKDTCQDKKTYSDKIFIQVYIRGSDGEQYGGYVDVDLWNVVDSDSDDLFKDKKDYIDMPDIDDYITVFPDFPEWDSDHPLDSIWAIVKWCGQCIVVVGKNLWGLMRWLKDSFLTLIKNLGIALYNLVVDIRRLLAYLFVPKSSNVEAIVKKKFPSFDKVIKAFNDVKNGKYAPISFTLLGNDVTFDLLSISSQLRNGLYTASTIVIRVVELFAVIKCVFKAFGVNPSGGEEEGS